MVYDLYTSAEEMQAKLLAGSTGYDVVAMAGLSMPQCLMAGIYQKLDKSKPPNGKHLVPAVLIALNLGHFIPKTGAPVW